MIRGTFLGIEIGKKGMLAAQAGLDTTGHNISNAGTEGYSRQRVNIRAAYPLSYPGPFVTLRPGQIGTGAEVYSITRTRSDFVEAQIHQENGEQQLYDIMDSTFTRIQNVLGEPGANGINGLMESFFNAWEDLSNDPESASARTNLSEQAQGLVNFVNEVDFKLTQEVTSINQQIEDRVVQLNSLAAQVANVNLQIIQLEGSGQGYTLNANDLKDRRDQLIEQMSGLINTRVIANSSGGVSVLIQGHPIVTDQYVQDIGLRVDPNDPQRPVLEFTKSRIPVAITSGEISGLTRMRDEEIPAVRGKLSELMTAFTNRVNVLHLEGYGLDGNKGRPFFADVEHRRVDGTVFLPGTTTLDTTLDTLGISSGDFFVQGHRIVIEDKEVLPGSAITLRQLLQRIDAANIDTRSQLDATTTSPRIVISQYNPVDASTPLSIKDGTSNFFEVTGLDKATVRDIPLEPKYQNSLHDFRLSSAILQDLDTIAAAGDDGLGFPGPGDNRTALAIADLKNDNQAVSQTTFGEFFQAIVATLGSAAQNAQNSLSSQQLVMRQLNARRQEISGVNLDEEAVNLIRYQRAFEACARAITTTDEVLDLIANRLGISGR
jgi:flagellar hook-associated protein 1 FlgK